MLCVYKNELDIFFFTIKYMINYNNLKKKKHDFNRANYMFAQPTL